MLISPPSACLPRSLLPAASLLRAPLRPRRSLLLRGPRRRRHPLPAPPLSRASSPPLASGTQPQPPRPSRPRAPRTPRGHRSPARAAGATGAGAPGARRHPGPRIAVPGLGEEDADLRGRAHSLSAGGLHAWSGEREPKRIQEAPGAGGGWSRGQNNKEGPWTDGRPRVGPQSGCSRQQSLPCSLISRRPQNLSPLPLPQRRSELNYHTI